MIVAGLLAISSFDIRGLPLDARSVLTGSMEPAIPTGSIVFIYPDETYQVGDIITFKRLESNLEVPITHRVVEVQESEDGVSYRTKGDANDGIDGKAVAKAEVYGKVIAHVPILGKLLDLSKTPWGFAMLIVVPAVLVIVDEVLKIVGYARVRKPEEIESSKKENEN